MKRWLENHHCVSCGSRLILQVDERKVCFICENDAQELKEAIEESEDFPAVMEALGKEIGTADQIVSRLNTPYNTARTDSSIENEHLEKLDMFRDFRSKFVEEDQGTFIGFINIIGLHPEIEFIDMNTLFLLARNIRNAKERVRKSRGGASSISKGGKGRTPRIPYAA